MEAVEQFIQQYAWVFQSIGVAVAFLYAIKFALFFLSSFFQMFKRYKYRKGSWCVITGASYGIGAGFVKAFAKRGLNIVLISRSADKLETLAKEMREKYNIETKVVSADFASTKPDAMKGVEDAVNNLDISVLVNNVGVSNEFPVPFEETTHSDVDWMTRVNVGAPNYMTTLIYPKMVKAKKGGLILNLSSFASTFGTPYLSVYAATKAYNKYFSISLSEEAKRHKIRVLSLNPMYVVSQMSKARRDTFFIPSAERFSEEALSYVPTNVTWVTPTLGHRVQVFFLSLLGDNRALSLIGSQSYQIRQKFLRRQKRKQEEERKKK